MLILLILNLFGMTDVEILQEFSAAVNQEIQTKNQEIQFHTTESYNEYKDQIAPKIELLNEISATLKQKIFYQIAQETHCKTEQIAQIMKNTTQFLTQNISIHYIINKIISAKKKSIRDRTNFNYKNYLHMILNQPLKISDL